MHGRITRQRQVCLRCARVNVNTPGLALRHRLGRAGRAVSARGYRNAHMNLSVLISAIAPVLVMLALGFGAGRQRAFDADQAKGLSHLALSFALPAALFLGMAHFNRSLLLQQGPVVLVMLIGYAALYPILFVVMRALGLDKLLSAAISRRRPRSSPLPLGYAGPVGRQSAGPVAGRRGRSRPIWLAALALRRRGPDAARRLTRRRRDLCERACPVGAPAAVDRPRRSDRIVHLPRRSACRIFPDNQTRRARRYDGTGRLCRKRDADQHPIGVVKTRAETAPVLKLENV
jgi:auxin efflux family transporter